MKPLARTAARLLTAVAAGFALAAPAHADGLVGTTFPPGFPIIKDASTGEPLIGFGAAGPVTRTPVILVHGNNDTPFATACNPYGNMHELAQDLAHRGYALSELWGLGYQGDQCDLADDPTRRSAEPHTAAANVADLRRFVHAVLRYTGARQVDIVGHSLGVIVAREWLRQDKEAEDLVRRCRDRRPEPRHHQLLAVAAQLLPAARVRRLHARQRALQGAGLAANAVPEAPQPWPRRSRR
jgi:triacylglycerol esterase/lipase EstA (alpha/beta hydrolase family)